MKPLHHLLAICGVLASPALLAFPPSGTRPAARTASADGYWDFRFGLGFEPMLTDADYETNAGDYEYDWEAGGASLEFNVAHRFDSPRAGAGYFTFGGFLRGFGGPDDPDTGTEVSVGAVGLQVGGGWSYRPSARYTLEIGPRIGIGSASATEEWGGDEYESDGGGYVRFDIGASNQLNFGKFQFGATVGVASWAATVPYEQQTVYVNGTATLFPEADATYSGSGVYLLLNAGFR